MIFRYLVYSMQNYLLDLVEEKGDIMGDYV